MSGLHQCIDACDEVMDKVKKPRGLITYQSSAQRAGLVSPVLRPRTMVYGLLCLLALGTLGVSLARRTPFECNVLRPRGGVPFVVDGDQVRNAFEVHLVNKNPGPSRFHITVTAPLAATVMIGTPDVELPSLTDAHVPVVVSIDEKLLGQHLELDVVVEDSASGFVKHQPFRFLQPSGR